MTESMINALVLLVFALVLMQLNLKAGNNLLKVVTYWSMLASVLGAGYFVAAAVFG